MEKSAPAEEEVRNEGKGGGRLEQSYSPRKRVPSEVEPFISLVKYVKCIYHRSQVTRLGRREVAAVGTSDSVQRPHGPSQPRRRFFGSETA